MVALVFPPYLFTNERSQVPKWMTALACAHASQADTVVCFIRDLRLQL